MKTIQKYMLLVVLSVVSTAVSAATKYSLTAGTLTDCSIKFYVNDVEVTEAEKGQTVVVKVTPTTDGYVVGEFTVNATAGFGEAMVRRGPGLLKDVAGGWSSGDDPNVYQFTMPDANVLVHVTCVEAEDGLLALIRQAEKLITAAYDEKIRNKTITDIELTTMRNAVSSYGAARNVYDNPASTKSQMVDACTALLQGLSAAGLLQTAGTTN